jgi:hypothetical protein
LKKKISEQKCNYFSGKKKHFRGCRIATEDDVCGDCCWRCCEQCEEEEGGKDERERERHTHTHTHTRARKIGPYPVKLNCANERGEV